MMTHLYSASGELSTERNKESTIRNRNGTESIPLPGLRVAMAPCACEVEQVIQ